MKFIVVIVFLFGVVGVVGMDAGIEDSLPSNTKTAAEQLALLPINCTDFRTNCDGHGICASPTECKCDKGYVTFGCPPEVQCCYQQQSRVVVFLISFFVGFSGAPYFILGASGLGAGILIMCCVGTCSTCFVTGAQGSEDKGTATCCTLMAAFAGMAFVGAMIWWLVLWIMVAANADFKDENGVSIATW